MGDQRVEGAVEGTTRLPTWVQCCVALVGAALLAGPMAAVVWYR